MTVFDACAIIAFLKEEPAAAIVEARLREEQEEARISCVNAAEIIDHMVRIAGASEDEISESLDWLVAGGLLITPADWDIGRRAGQLRARRYRRGSASFSLGDCMALSTAISFRKPLATSDAALAELARQEGVEVIALPNSRGEKP